MLEQMCICGTHRQHFFALPQTDFKVFTKLTLGGTNFSKRRFITAGIQDFARGVIYGDYSPPREWYATASLKH
jgi:hypothetical protein